MKEYAKTPSRNLKKIQTPDSYLFIGTKIHRSKLIYFMYRWYLILQDLSISNLELPVFNTVEKKFYPYSELHFFGSVWQLGPGLLTAIYWKPCDIIFLWLFICQRNSIIIKTFSVRTLVKTCLKLIGHHTDTNIRQRSWYTLS